MDQHQWNVWLRTDFAEKAGLNLKNPPKDRKTFVEWATKLTKKSGDNFTVAGWAIGYPNPKSLLWSAIYSNGGEWNSEDGNKCTINSPESVEAFQYIVDLYGKVSSNATDLLADFVTGKTASVIERALEQPRPGESAGHQLRRLPTPTLVQEEGRAGLRPRADPARRTRTPHRWAPRWSSGCRTTR